MKIKLFNVHLQASSQFSAIVDEKKKRVNN